MPTLQKTLLRYSGTFQNGQPNAHLPGLWHSAGTGKHRRFHGGTGENPVCNAPKVPHVTALFALCGLSEHLPKNCPKSKSAPHRRTVRGLVGNVINLKRPLNGKQNVWKYQNGEEKSDSDGREKDV